MYQHEMRLKRRPCTFKIFDLSLKHVNDVGTFEYVKLLTLTNQE